ncbi:MAG TPA: hypothetical protein VF715_00075 [Thermoleophilaceae bacterium]
MTTFLLDIWHDLREKRLWPIAVALVAATVAIPMVLMKPAAVPPPAQAPQGAQTAALPTVAPDPTIVDSSHLDAFDIRNPFGSGADRTPGTSTPGGDPADGATGSSGSGSATGDLPGAAGSTGGSGGGTAGGGGGGGTGGSGGSGGSGGGTRYFTYTVDVRFGARGETRAFKGIETLDLLPDDQTPIVSFMGMRDNAKTAVFFIVDPNFEADGEGECAPSAEDCRFIYLGVDEDRNEETLAAADGNLEFQLKLDRIHIKNMSQAEAQGDAQPDADSPQRKGQSKSKARRTLLTVPLAARR